MTDLDTIIEQLENWKAAIENAITSVTALRGIEGIIPSSAPVKRVATKKKSTKKRTISPEARRKMAEASRERWSNLKKSASTAKKTVVKKQTKGA